VQVFQDGKLWGTLKLGAPRVQNIHRHPALGAQLLEFKRPGYKTISLNTAEFQGPVYRFKLDREPSVTLDLAGALGNQKFSGEAVLDGDSFLAGTSEGSLLRVSNLQGKAACKRYDLPGGGGLGREVYGAPMALKRADKSNLIVYCTKAGDCLGLLETEAGFREAWPPLKGDPLNSLTAPPATAKLNLLGNHTLCLIPLGKKLAILDAESGLRVRQLELKQTITATPCALEQNLIVAGCANGALYGVNLANEITHTWNTNAAAAAIRGKPVLFEDLLLACAEDGRLYFFDSRKDGFRLGDVLLEGVLASEPLVLKHRLYLGSMQRENFYCVDLATRSELWRVKDCGGVAHPPASLGKRVYFTTQTGRLYALDAEKGAPHWIYQLEQGHSFVSGPLILGQMVYAFADNGKILGFDEAGD
jgi:outer membrane protein assembly factor BamB